MLDNIKAGIFFLCVIIPFMLGLNDIFNFLFGIVSKISCTIN